MHLFHLTPPSVTFRSGFISYRQLALVPVSYVRFFFWVAATCCLVAHLAILRSVLRASDRAGAVVSSRRRLVEIAWAVVPALALAAVLLMTWRGIQTRS